MGSRVKTRGSPSCGAAGERATRFWAHALGFTQWLSRPAVEQSSQHGLTPDSHAEERGTPCVHGRDEHSAAGRTPHYILLIATFQIDLRPLGALSLDGMYAI